ncbi:Dihydrodipicolinate synthase [Lithohypha guttulata]|uniref:Dihydrodipicolinate synthase n=1 Tax=Lithohypha guttulata TaxID=1690604 RepID=UPI002DE17791|nr:Dihydrodipicolinate synthase [Lithohypha guttulata]KAK5106773.1 Dihydrodipicolinate synthase [Lithohypha guttulata]
MSVVTSSIVASATLDPYNLGLSPQLEAYRSGVREQFGSTVTPLNVALLVVLLTFTYYRLIRPYNAASQTLHVNKDQPIVFQTFTPRTLLKFNGLPNPPLNPDGKVYLAVKGKVHDVTSGRNFYGPGGPYENFAGRDATRGLACQSFDEDMLTKNLDGPLDDCSDLGADQLENLQGWVERFDEKYLVVGKLVAYNKNQVHGM